MDQNNDKIHSGAFTADFAKVQHVWSQLADEDPLWAILSHPGKEGGKWQIVDFLAEGQKHVGAFFQLLREVGAPESYASALDFGCGVGRCSRAWRNYVQVVTGVDVAQGMVEQARRLNADIDGLHFVHNPYPDLREFSSNTYDLVFTYIVLQHMPFRLARVYLQDFVRICRPGGWLTFQIPEPPPNSQILARFRRFIIDRLPFGLGAWYRKKKYGRSVLFNMHFTAPQVIHKFLQEAGMELKATIVDPSAKGLEGVIYIARKPE